MLQQLPDPIIVFFSSMLPVLELRFAIPYGMAALGMSKWEALFWGFSGNLLSAVLLIQLLDPVTKWVRTLHPKFDQLVDWIFHKTRTKHSKRMSELGHLALLLFVAVPLPGSGSWTGSLVAYLFGVQKRISLAMISLGLTVAAFLVTFGTQGILNLIERALGV